MWGLLRAQHTALLHATGSAVVGQPLLIESMQPFLGLDREARFGAASSVIIMSLSFAIAHGLLVNSDHVHSAVEDKTAGLIREIPDIRGTL